MLDDNITVLLLGVRFRAEARLLLSITRLSMDPLRDKLLEGLLKGFRGAGCMPFFFKLPGRDTVFVVLLLGPSDKLVLLFKNPFGFGFDNFLFSMLLLVALVLDMWDLSDCDLLITLDAGILLFRRLPTMPFDMVRAIEYVNKIRMLFGLSRKLLKRLENVNNKIMQTF